MKAWCIFCKTGTEKDAAKYIAESEKDIEAIAPVRILQEKRKGHWRHKEQILFPGYLFLYGEKDIDPGLIARTPGFYKLLGYDASLRELQGTDYEYAMWLHRYQGCLEISKVFTIGKLVKVIEGPLADGIGRIVKLDKHKRKIWVEFEFDGQTRLVTLSAECVEEQ